MAVTPAVNLTIDKGVYFEETFYLTGEDGLKINLSGKTAAARIKKHPTAQKYHSFSTTITVGDATVKISMGSTITADLPSGRCCYDVVVADTNGSKTKVVEGNAIVKETIST